MCGEALVSICILLDAEGLSPHVRGSPARKSKARVYGRSIPACAGKPGRRSGECRLNWVYPRMCGEAGNTRLLYRLHLGLSPHVRGSPCLKCSDKPVGRSIPACAGKPSPRSSACWGSGVYPRMCGEASYTRSSEYDHMGLSPHVRGSLFGFGIRFSPEGSIPACAGKPRRPRPGLRSLVSEVYPRMCGEASRWSPSLVCGEGLSPHVRGSLGRGRTEACCLRSIPACAGKPIATAHGCCRLTVYPRMCGEATPTSSSSDRLMGLSPHVRGSRRGRHSRERHNGSIPACAGKPNVMNPVDGLF